MVGGEVPKNALEKAIRKRIAVGGKASQGQLDIAAEVVRAALLATEESGNYGVLWLRNVRIKGVLDLRDLELRTRLRLHGCEFDEKAQIDQLGADDVELLDCRLPKGLTANQVAIRRNLKLDRSEMGPIALRGAKINGYLSLEGSRLRESGNGEAENLPALDMEAAEVAGGIHCGQISSEGAIQMTGAKVGHRLSLNGATLKAGRGEGFALNADGVEITGSLICHQAEIEGDFRLRRAEIHSQLSLSNSSLIGELNMLGASVRGELALIGAKFINPAGRTIKGDRMQIGGGIHCGGKFESAGLVRMVGARIGDQIGFEKAILTGGLVLVGATVEGFVDLEEAHVAGPTGGWAVNADGLRASGGFYARGLRTIGEVRLVGAKLEGSVSFDDSALLNEEGFALNGERVEVNGTFSCVRASVATGGIRLAGARISDSLVFNETKVIGGVLLTGISIKFDLSLDGAFLGNEQGPALTGDRSVVGGSFVGHDGFRANGELRVAGSRLGSMSFSGAVMTAAEEEGTGIALQAEGAVVAGSVNLEEASLSGSLRLSGAKVASQVVLSGANIICKTGSALSADRLTAKDGVFCMSGFQATGEVRFNGAQIGGQMCLNGSFFLAATAADTALSLVSSEIDELVPGTEKVVGVIDLRHAKVRNLFDAGEGRMGATQVSEIRLDGFSYESLREPLDAERRLPWLASLQKRYVPGVYVELAAAFRRIGRYGDARKVAIAGERRARQELKKWSPRGIFQDLLWVTVGYGYANWLAFFWMIALIAVGSSVFCLGESSFVELLHPSPHFNPVLYAIDATVPVLELGQQRAWAPVGAMAWVSLFLSVSGWALATAVIAAAAGLLNRDQK